MKKMTYLTFIYKNKIFYFFFLLKKYYCSTLLNNNNNKISEHNFSLVLLNLFRHIPHVYFILFFFCILLYILMYTYQYQ